MSRSAREASSSSSSRRSARPLTAYGEVAADPGYPKAAAAANSSPSRGSEYYSSPPSKSLPSAGAAAVPQAEISPDNSVKSAHAEKEVRLSFF